MAIPTVESLRPRIMKILGISEFDVMMRFGADYPECLEMVVLRDISLSKMEKVGDLLSEMDGGLRLCANIIEKKDAPLFRGLTDDEIWTESWNYCIATVRLG
jgi:hypothetical protein